MILKYFKYKLSSDEKLARREKLLIEFLAVTPFFAVLYSSVSWYIDYPIGMYAMFGQFVAHVVALIAFNNLMITRVQAANIYLGAGAIAVQICTFFSGGLESPVAPWMIIIPAVSFLILGNKKHTWIWMASTLAIVLVIITLHLSGYSFPKAYNLEFETVFLHICVSGLLFILYTLNTIFTIERDKTDDEFRI